MGKWMRAVLVLIGCAFLTRFLPTSFFRNVDTMVHEFGHALMVLLLSGKVMNISLYADHSGVTQSALASASSFIPVSLAGYMTASLFAWLLFALYAKRQYALGLWLVTGIAALSLALFVRNGFGMSWLAGLLVLNLLFLLFPYPLLRKYYFLFIAFLSLEESVMGPLTLVILAVRNGGAGAGDASILARLTPLPGLVWALLFFLFALWCAKLAIDAFSGRGRRQPPTNQTTAASRPDSIPSTRR
ncbi:M50 family metallopeptidase [Gorillibacterium sp. CAU 1737]|uniref:M50 family metallopeptidase n=1 Tax=Gorillibacterium sp. CAU 1737 TaxID=3140362 RepID=UPI003260C429